MIIEDIAERSISLCTRPAPEVGELMPLSGGLYSYGIYYRIDDIQEVWDRVSLPESLSQSPYLRTIERDESANMNNIYVIVYDKNEEPIGAILYQSFVMRLSDSFNYERYANNRGRIGRAFLKMRQYIISWFNFRALIMGNLYLTGQYGFHFIDKTLSATQLIKIVDSISLDLRRRLCNTKYRFNAVLYKDYFENEQLNNTQKHRLHSFQIDPNMILRVRDYWSSFDDYLADMRSKYRIRMKNAMKKFHGVERRVLSLEDVRRYHERMHELYESILDGSGFVLARAEQQYFMHLKEELGENLHVVGYFLDGEMIAFYNWVIDGGKLDAHFIGVHSALNLRHQLYLNILLDLVRDAITYGADYVYYYRTALEIKSSVGAEPYDMILYGRHNNRLINLLTPLAFRYFVPHQKWIQRHPFKRERASLA